MVPKSGCGPCTACALPSCVVTPHRLPEMMFRRTREVLLGSVARKLSPLPPSMGLFWMLLSEMMLPSITVEILFPICVMPKRLPVITLLRMEATVTPPAQQVAQADTAGVVVKAFDDIVFDSEGITGDARAEVDLRAVGVIGHVPQEAAVGDLRGAGNICAGTDS